MRGIARPGAEREDGTADGGRDLGELREAPQSLFAHEAVGVRHVEGRVDDPDGQGDLKRNNQVAFRAEVVYGWGISTLDAFSKLVKEG